MILRTGSRSGFEWRWQNERNWICRVSFGRTLGASGTGNRHRLEFDPKTDGPYKKPSMIGNEPEGAVKYRGEVMLVYPADVGRAFLAYYGVTGDARFLAAAKGIGETYLKTRRSDGSWPLKMKLATGMSSLAMVDPLIGTEGEGYEYGGMQPYACVPFRSLHAVPMTRARPLDMWYNARHATDTDRYREL